LAGELLEIRRRQESCTEQGQARLWHSFHDLLNEGDN
jgi:hypothetical protein